MKYSGRGTKHVICGGVCPVGYSVYLVGFWCVCVFNVHVFINLYMYLYFRASFMSKSLMVDNSTIKFQIWDTAGQERVSPSINIFHY